jgi:hypothetical protein
MRAMRSLPSLKQHLNIDGHVFEEVRIFKYSGPLITEKMKFVKKINMTTAAGSHCYCGLQHICKSETIKKSSVQASNMNQGPWLKRINLC